MKSEIIEYLMRPGETLLTVSTKLGIAKQTVYDHLIRSGRHEEYMQKRKKEGIYRARDTSARDAMIMNVFMSGEATTVKGIAAKCKVARATARNTLKKYLNQPPTQAARQTSSLYTESASLEWTKLAPDDYMNLIDKMESLIVRWGKLDTYGTVSS